MNSICAVQPRILVADDQPDLIDALRLLLKREGIHVDSVGSPEAALSAIAAGSFDLLLMDLNYTGDTTSGREGIDLLSRVQALDRELPIVVMTGWGSVDIAVEAMRRGVRNFVQKPWDNAQLVAILRDRSRRRARAAAAGRDRAPRARRGAAHPAQAAARRPCRRSMAGKWRCRGSRRPASAATASTPSPSARRASACRLPTSSARAFPRRC